MSQRRFWPVPLFLLLSGCFYDFAYLDAGPGVGIGTATSAGSSSSGSTAGGSSSSGGGSTAGGSTSNGGGSSGGGSTSGGGTTLCAPPAGNGWPLSCTPLTDYLELGEPPGDISVIPVDGGFLIGTVATAAAQINKAALGTLMPKSGGGWDLEPGGITTADVTYSLSMTPPAGSSPSTLLGGAQSDFDGSITQLICASPADTGAAGTPFSFAYDANGDLAEVDKVRLAQASNGTLAFVIADSNGEDGNPVGWGMGPAGGGCPSSARAIPALPSPLASASTPEDSAIAPFGVGQFAIAEVYADFTAGDDVLALFSEPSGTAIGTPTSYGFAAAPHVAVASDGTHLSVVASDIGAGVLLYGLDGGGLQQLATLSGANGNGLAAGSCGSDCALVGWVEESELSDGGVAYLPKYAVVNSAGCGLAQAFPEVVGGGPASAAVAYLPGTAVFFYALNSGGTNNLFGIVCTP